jgi:hypothetical protein
LCTPCFQALVCLYLVYPMLPGQCLLYHMYPVLPGPCLFLS